MSKSIYTHKHHIIPKHAGGSDDPSNIVELTTEEHALAHKKLFEQYGRWQDELAYLGLSGQIGREEAIRRAQSLSNKGNQNSLGCKRTQEYKDNISKKMKGKRNALGHKQTDEDKKKKSIANKKWRAKKKGIVN